MLSAVAFPLNLNFLSIRAGEEYKKKKMWYSAVQVEHRFAIYSSFGLAVDFHVQKVSLCIQLNNINLALRAVLKPFDFQGRASNSLLS